jgi:ketosteroid isomerase-like protein
MDEQANLQTVQGFYQTVKDRDLAATPKLVADDLDWKDVGADRDVRLEHSDSRAGRVRNTMASDI